MRYALEPPKEGHIWEFYYDLLRSFVERTGHADVPKHHIEKGFALGIWVHKQRANSRRLTPEQMTALENIEPWLWENETGASLPINPLVRAEPKKQALGPAPSRPPVESKTLFADSNPQRSLPNAYLGNRLTERGADASLHSHRGDLFQKQEKQTEQENWQSRYELLVQFMNREGHCLVPRKHKEGKYKLGKWVRRQQRLRLSMPESQRSLLEKMAGWSWEPVEHPWDVLFNLLQVFCEREGQAEVPKEHVEQGYKLGVWVSRQKKNYRKERLQGKRAEMLESLPGWEWETVAESAISEGCLEEDSATFVRDVWKSLVGRDAVNELVAAQIAARALHEAGLLAEENLRIGSADLVRINDAFERCVELGLMDRPEERMIRAIPASSE